MLVELLLGDLYGQGEVFIRQFRVDDLVAVLDQKGRLDAARDRLPAVEEEDFHLREWTYFAKSPVGVCGVNSDTDDLVGHAGVILSVGLPRTHAARRPPRMGGRPMNDNSARSVKVQVVGNQLVQEIARATQILRPSHAPIILPSDSGSPSRWSEPTSTRAEAGRWLLLTSPSLSANGPTQFGVDDLVAVPGQEGRLEPAWDRLPAVGGEDFHPVVLASFSQPDRTGRTVN